VFGCTFWGKEDFCPLYTRLYVPQGERDSAEKTKASPHAAERILIFLILIFIFIYVHFFRNTTKMQKWGLDLF
jgi:hypothetical protein